MTRQDSQNKTLLVSVWGWLDLFLLFSPLEMQALMPSGSLSLAHVLTSSPRIPQSENILQLVWWVIQTLQDTNEVPVPHKNFQATWWAAWWELSVQTTWFWVLTLLLISAQPWTNYLSSPRLSFVLFSILKMRLK